MRMILEKKGKEKKDLVVALSGGVDSAVAAWLAKESGARVRAVFMRNWRDDDMAAGCHDKADLIAATACAAALDLDFEVVDFADDYWQKVFLPFLDELKEGKTPNPDILCNSQIKFTAFADYGRRVGAEAMVTGHYARIKEVNGQQQLCQSEDSAKDQTYFLHRLTQDQLAYGCFPLAVWHKNDVRAQAKRIGLNNWSRKDSTGICFIGERHFAEFLSHYLPKTPGDIVSDKGVRLGQHDGLHFYTIGQRHGLRLGGGGGPWFVFLKDRKNNILMVSKGEDNPCLFCQKVCVENLHWIANTPPRPQLVYTARLRHRQQPASCTLSRVSAASIEITFAEPQRAVTPGQYAVIYDGNVCLGGGVIREGFM